MKVELTLTVAEAERVIRCLDLAIKDLEGMRGWCGVNSWFAKELRYTVALRKRVERLVRV